MRARLALILVLFLTGCQSTASHAPSSVSPSTVVAVVGRHGITPAELNAYVRYVVGFDALAYPDSAEAQCARSPKGTACRHLRDEALTRLLQEQIVSDYASAHQIRLDASDRQAVEAEIGRLSGPTSPTRKLFRNGTVTRTFMRSVLDRQVLVQKVQDHLTGERALKGPALRLRRIHVDSAPGAGRDASYAGLLSVASGGPLPAGATVRVDWLAEFRVPPAIRRALKGARIGDYAGPFDRDGGLLLVQLLGRGVHSYGGPARQKLTAQLFARWLDNALRHAHPRCLDARHRLAPCPARIVKAA